MERLKRLTKPLIALFLVIVFAWIVFITRYQYLPASGPARGVTLYERVDRWTGEREFKLVGEDKYGKRVNTKWEKIEKD